MLGDNPERSFLGKFGLGSMPCVVYHWVRKKRRAHPFVMDSSASKNLLYSLRFSYNKRGMKRDA